MTGFTQGDAFPLPVMLKDSAGLIDPDLISEIEFRIGPLRKMYPVEVEYDPERGVYLFPLTQAETFALKSGPVACQARVKFYGGNAVIGTGKRYVDLHKSISKVVL